MKNLPSHPEIDWKHVKGLRDIMHIIISKLTLIRFGGL